MKLSGGNEKTQDTKDPTSEFIKRSCAHRPEETAWKERESIKKAGPAFKSFIEHAHERKDVSTSNADDRRCYYALHLRTGAFA